MSGAAVSSMLETWKTTAKLLPRTSTTPPAPPMTFDSVRQIFYSHTNPQSERTQSQASDKMKVILKDELPFQSKVKNNI